MDIGKSDHYRARDIENSQHNFTFLGPNQIAPTATDIIRLYMAFYTFIIKIVHEVQIVKMQNVK